MGRKIGADAVVSAARAVTMTRGLAWMMAAALCASGCKGKRAAPRAAAELDAAALEHVIELDKSSVHLDGETLAEVQAILADPNVVVPALQTALEALVRDGGVPDPLLLRARGDTDVKVIGRVVTSIYRARFRTLSLELADGKDHTRIDAYRSPTRPGGGLLLKSPRDLPLTASVLLDRGMIRIGTTRDPPRVLPDVKGARDLAGFGKALTELHADPKFTGREDLELAAVDGLPFRELIAIIQACHRAGFRDVLVLRPPNLTANPAR